MKRFTIAITILILSSSLFGQQLPLYSQYYFNSMVYNPSHTGIEEGTSISLVGRKQFTGIANAIGTYGGIFQTKQANSGFGLYVYSDDLNLFSTNSATGSYAFHVPLNNDNVLSLGLGLSLIDSRYNRSNFFLVDEGDPIIANLGNGGGITFDANAGFNLQLGKFAFGLANLQLIQNQERFEADDKTLYTLASHWMFNASYKIAISDALELEPILLYRKAPAAPGQTDINLFLNWQNKGYAGIAYRDGMSVSGMLGVNVAPTITAGYAFDLTTHKFRTALGNTHELMIKFDIGRRAKLKSELLAEEERKLYEKKIALLQEAVASNEGTARIDTFIMERIIEVEKDNSLSETERKKYESEITKLKEELKALKESESTKVDTVVVVKEVKKADKPITPIEDEKPDVIKTGKYYVIAGSFGNSDQAKKYISQLKSKGIESNMKLAKNGRYYVYTSNHTTKESAVNYVERMKGSGLSLWIKVM